MFYQIQVYAVPHGVYDQQITPHVYLHGDLTDWNGGFDLCRVKNLPETEGVYECETVFEDGHIIPSILYFWFGKEPFHNRGLVVDKRDTESMNDAKQKYESRVNNL